MLAALGCGVCSWSSRRLDNGLSVCIDNIGGFHLVLIMPELGLGNIPSFFVDLREHSMAGGSINSSAVGEVVLEGPLR